MGTCASKPEKGGTERTHEEVIYESVGEDLTYENPERFSAAYVNENLNGRISRAQQGESKSASISRDSDYSEASNSFLSSSNFSAPYEGIAPNTSDFATQTDYYQKSQFTQIEDMIDNILPLLQDSIRVMDIIPHLPFIDDKRTFRTKDRESPRDAVVLLIDRLKASEEPGKWQAFLQALSKGGYQYLHYFLKDETDKNLATRRSLLQLFPPSLISRMDSREFVHDLCERNVIDATDMEEIKCEETDRGPTAASLMLLECVPRKHPDWYNIVVDVLTKSGLHDVNDEFTVPSTDSDTTSSCFTVQAGAKNYITPVAPDLPCTDGVTGTESWGDRDPKPVTVRTSDDYSQAKCYSECCKSLVSTVEWNRHIEFMVDVFRIPISTTVQLLHILPHLTCIDNVQERRLSARCKQDPVDAMDMLINYLKESTEPGKWQQFIQALKNEEYDTLIKLILSNLEDTSDIQRRLLRVCRTTLIERIYFDEFIDKLFERRVISATDKDEIERTDRTMSSREAAVLFLQRIPTKLPNWFEMFMQVCKECQLEDVVELLDLDLQSKSSKHVKPTTGYVKSKQDTDTKQPSLAIQPRSVCALGTTRTRYVDVFPAEPPLLWNEQPKRTSGHCHQDSIRSSTETENETLSLNEIASTVTNINEIDSCHRGGGQPYRAGSVKQKISNYEERCNSTSTRPTKELLTIDKHKKTSPATTLSSKQTPANHIYKDKNINWKEHEEGKMRRSYSGNCEHIGNEHPGEVHAFSEMHEQRNSSNMIVGDRQNQQHQSWTNQSRTPRGMSTRVYTCHEEQTNRIVELTLRKSDLMVQRELETRIQTTEQEVWELQRQCNGVYECGGILDDHGSKDEGSE